MSYQPGIIYERTSAERADPFLSWAREDKAFFAAGACHILADLFIQLHMGESFETVYIRPQNSTHGHHVYATNGTWAFDFNGWTKEAELLDAYAKAYVSKFPGWKYDRIVIKDGLEVFCRDNYHRLPWQFPYLPWERAYKYIKQFGSIPT
jgi:hypothetical protein